MLPQRLSELFKSYDATTQQVVGEVIELEQRYISMQRPRGIYSDIDEIIARIAQQEIDRNNASQEDAPYEA